MCRRCHHAVLWLERQRRFSRWRKLLGASIALRHTGVSKDLIIRLNDSGKTFEEIADYLDNIIPEKYHDNNYMT